MKQIVQNVKTGELSILDVPVPQIGAGEVLVATKASLISAGTERMLVDFAKKSLLGKAQERPDLVKQVMTKMARDGVAATTKAVFSRLEEPMPLGYSAAGEVLAVGEGMSHLYSKGDRVVMAGAGLANHAELNAIPKNLLAKIPDNVTYEQACFGTVGAIAMHGVRNAEINFGDNVLVLGLGLVGQLAAQFATAAGARVFGMDYDPSRVELAIENGLAGSHVLGQGMPDSIVKDFTAGKGFDSILICAATDSDEPINNAADWARDRARVVLVGMVGTKFSYAAFMKKELNVIVSRSYGPGRYDVNYEGKGQEYPIGWVRWTERDNLEETVRLMGNGKLNVSSLITHEYPVEEAHDAYALVMGKEIPSMGVVLTYGASNEQRLVKRIENPDLIEIADQKQIGISLIGAGAFARGVLIPAIKEMQNTMGLSLSGIVTKTGMSAQSTAKRFGFAFATSDVESLLGDASTQAVMIMTRHGEHAAQVSAALKAGKHVFVEKPLALTFDQLDQVKKSYKGAAKVMMVGFNRRFAPLTQTLVNKMDSIKGPRQIVMRVNAGKIPADNWQNDPAVGGGRLLGEVCHFIDLAVFFAKSKATEVYASQGEGQDNYAITIKFANGGQAQILYTSEGDNSFSKEYIEVYAGGAVGVIDNFRKGTFTQKGRTVKLHKTGIKELITGGQNKGHKEQLRQFFAAVKGQQTPPIKSDELFAITNLTLMVKESLTEGKPLKV